MSTHPTRTSNDNLDLGETIRGLNSDIVLFGRFKTKRILGRGGMGEVFRARDRSTDSLVAVKLLRPGLSLHEARLVRFRKEVVDKCGG